MFFCSWTCFPFLKEGKNGVSATMWNLESEKPWQNESQVAVSRRMIHVFGEGFGAGIPLNYDHHDASLLNKRGMSLCSSHRTGQQRSLRIRRSPRQRYWPRTIQEKDAGNMWVWSELNTLKQSKLQTHLKRD